MVAFLRKIYHALVPQEFADRWRVGYHIKRLLNRLLTPIRILFSLPLKKKLEKIRFEVHLAEHCNLNCQGCSHFSPLAGPELVEVEGFRRDMERMGELFSHECQEIHLLGGEPLLHPDLITLLKITRDNFPIGDIIIITNGILLPKQEDAFWRSCHENKIKIRVTNYPIQLDVDTIQAAAEKFDVPVDVSWYGSHWKHTFVIIPLDPSGRRDIKRNFARCEYANLCIALSHGKLFTCHVAAYIRYFNQKFKQNFSVDETDYVDIYKENSKDIILEKLSEPIPFCRYCDFSRRRTCAWGISKRDINEWL